MSGHSKWHNIKRKKEAKDAKKSKIFSKMSRAVTVATRQGGGDPDKNPTLRLAIEKAKSVDMPKENIERAIKKGVGELSSENFESVLYEGFGPGGVAFLVNALTDNKNRTVSELRNVFSRFGGSLGVTGSVSYIFGVGLEKPSYEVEVENQATVAKLQKLVSTLEENDDVQEIYSNFKVLEKS